MPPSTRTAKSSKLTYTLPAGSSFTVTLIFFETLPIFTVMTAVPNASPVIKPWDDTDATPSLDELHFGVVLSVVSSGTYVAVTFAV